MEENLKNAFGYAIETGNKEMFDLLAKDFENYTQEDKNMLLELTVVNSPSTEFIQHVLDYGYDINYKNEVGNTLLHFAAASSYPESVSYFLAKGLDLESKNIDGSTPLRTAAEVCDNTQVLQTLIDAGADIHTINNSGENLLITAARNPNPEITKFVLKLGFDTEDRDNDGFTALLNAACWQPNIEVLDILKNAGADIYAKTNSGDNLFHITALSKNKEVARYVSTAFNTSDVNQAGISCLEKVLLEGKSPEVLKVFLKKMKEEQVFCACMNSNPEILETLIQQGYDVNTKDCTEKSALMFAANTNDNPEMIKMLLCYGASWENHDDNGRNVLHYAAANQNPAIYDWMLKEKRFIKFANEKDSNGNLPEYYRENLDEF